MRHTTLGLICALLATGCGEKDTTGGDDTAPSTDDSGEENTLPENEATGSVELRDESASADIAIAKAFAFHSDTLTFVYAASNPAATCALVGELFDPDGDDVDKGQLFLPGHCNMSFSVLGGPPVPLYDLQTDSGGTVNTECAFGDGSWTYRTDVPFPDYYWSGEYFTASAWKGSFDINLFEDGADHLVIDALIREWEGTFPYSTDPERTGEHLASGRLEGVIYAERCDALERTGWF